MRTPKYRLRPDRDYAFVEIDGERIRLPGRKESAESLDAYSRVVADYVATKKPGAQRKAKRRESIPSTVSEIAVLWLDHCRLYYPRVNTTSGEYQNCRMAIRPLLELYGGKRVGDLCPSDIRIMRDRAATGAWSGARKPWSRQYINACVGKVKRMLRWGVENDLVHPDVCNRIGTMAPLARGRGPAKESKKVTQVEPEHVQATLPFLDRTVAAMVQLQQLTGMRSDNVCSIRPCDVDQRGDVWIYRPAAHKTDYRGKELVVPLGPKAQEVLKPFMGEPEQLCFLRKNGRRYYAQLYWVVIKRAIDRANLVLESKIPHWHPHQLRHLRTALTKREGGLEAARALLGHSSVKTTEIYDERDMTLALEMARRLG